ncbi:recombination mediator RecR [Patescibacteria group bacterium]|nr:recombination mediator RecR [Patescibacteria group bacterium]
MKTIKPVQNLIDEFRKLPTIGPKTAARLVYFLLRAPEEESLRLAEAVTSLKQQTVVCSRCFNVAESDPCEICSDENRQQGVICVVEEPLDVLAIENTGKFHGVYHVLGGVINPIAGIGPEELRINELMGRLSYGDIGEVILAMNPTMEGEATAMYIKKQVQSLPAIALAKVGEKFQPKAGPPLAEKVKSLEGIKITRIARGLPTGGDLEYADSVTLSRALEGRTEF